MNTIYLHGALGNQFVKKIETEADNAYDVIKCLDANYEGFAGYLVKQSLEGNDHFLISKHPAQIESKKDFENSCVNLNKINQEVHIVPASYGGFISAALVGIGVSTAIAGAITAAIWGGLAQLAINALTDTPEDKVQTSGEKIETKSFLISSSSETASQGGALPLGYGRVFVGPCLIGQSMDTFRRGGDNLESRSVLTFKHIISEGPIEGPVNEYGQKIDPWINVGGKLEVNPDIQKSLYINESQLQKAEFFSYILNEEGIPPMLNIDNKRSKILTDYESIIYTVNKEMFGVSPYYEHAATGKSSTKTYIEVDEAFASSADLEKPSLVSHKVSSVDVTDLVMNFRTSVFNNDRKTGNTISDYIVFAVFIIDESGERDNVFEARNKYLVREKVGSVTVGGTVYKSQLIDRNGRELSVYIDENNLIWVRGIATGAYQFSLEVKIKNPGQKHSPTLQFVKLSKETDLSAASNIYTQWTTTKRKWWGGKKVSQHEKQTWNSIGGQGRSRSISLTTVEERKECQLSHPNTAVSKVVIDSLNFAGQPSLMWHLKLKKVAVPSNYDPTTRTYDGPWNGLFYGQKANQSIHSIDEDDLKWTDNPAWVFYDILSNSVYGAGKYGVGMRDIDKWQLYKVAKYCDEMVETNYPIQTLTGMPLSFEYEKAFRKERGNFKIKMDPYDYYRSAGGVDYTDISNDTTFNTYQVFDKPGDYEIEIPEGFGEVEILCIGSGGSGTSTGGGVYRMDRFHIGINAYLQAGLFGFDSWVYPTESNWHMLAEGGYGADVEDTEYLPPPTVDYSGHEPIEIIPGVNPIFGKPEGRGRAGTASLLIPEATGGEPTSYEDSVPERPRFGAGQGSMGNLFKFKVMAAQRGYGGEPPVNLNLNITGGGSGAACFSKVPVRAGEKLKIRVGEGGVMHRLFKDYSHKTAIRTSFSGRRNPSDSGGSHGYVALGFVKAGKYSVLSAEDRFKEVFGEGEKYKGKSVAFFVNKHNLGDAAVNHKQLIKDKSVLRENCEIFRRQIVSSNPENFTVVLSGESLSKNDNCFTNPQTNKATLYGACAVEIDHPIVEHRFSANFHLKESMEAIELMRLFSSLFRTRLSYSSGKISLIQDSKESPLQIFNNTNVSKEGFFYSGSEKNQRFSVVKVAYNNKDSEFRQSFVYEEDSAAIKKIGVIEKSVVALSITSESEARRLAQWVLLTSQYEQEVVKFTAGQEGSYTFPGSIIEIFDEMRTGNVRGGRIVDILEKEGGDILVLDRDAIKEPVLGQVDLTVSVAFDYETLDKIESRASNESSSINQDDEISNLKSNQLIVVKGRVVPDYENQSQSMFVDMSLKMEIDVDEQLRFKVFYHGFKNGDSVKFDSDGRLPSGLSPFFDYYIVGARNHSFMVSLTEPSVLSGKVSASLNSVEIYGVGTNFISDLSYGDYVCIDEQVLMVNEVRSDSLIIVNSPVDQEINGDDILKNVNPVMIFGEGRDRLGNLGGRHFIIPNDRQKTLESLRQIMIGATYSIKGDIGVISDDRKDIDSGDLTKLGISSPLTQDWMLSSIFGSVKIMDRSWIYAKNLGWIYIREVLENTSSIKWFYIGDFGWCGAFIGLQSAKWFVPALKQNTQADGFVVPLYNALGDVVQVYISYKNVDEDLDQNLSYHYIGSSNNKLGRLCEVTEYVSDGYIVSVLDNKEDSDSFENRSSIDFSPGFEVYDSKYLSLQIDSIFKVSKEESLQQREAIRIQFDNRLSYSGSQSIRTNNLYKYYRGMIRYKPEIGSSVIGPELIHSERSWDFIIVNEDTVELVYHGEIGGDDFLWQTNIGWSENYDFSMLVELGSDYKKFMEGKFYKVVSNKEIADLKYEITATESNQSKFDAIDKKGVIRKPVLPIPPQEAMNVPEAPTDLFLFSS